jgi:hypothetical protein
MNRFFDELFMLATDHDLGFDKEKWIEKGYSVVLESTTMPVACEIGETGLLVRKRRNMPHASMPGGYNVPPPMYRVRSRPSSASSVLQVKKI